jgi:hypothetical protein
MRRLNRLRTRTLMITYVLIAMLAISHVAVAQQKTAPGAEWAAVTAVQPGDKLVVKLREGKSVEGKLSSVSGETLTLAHNKKTTELNRGDVLKVYRVTGKSAASSTLIGAGVGAAAGAGTGAAVCGGCNDKGSFDFGPSRSVITAGAALVGAGLGAIVGFALGRRHKRVLIYEAR